MSPKDYKESAFQALYKYVTGTYEALLNLHSDIASTSETHAMFKYHDTHKRHTSQAGQKHSKSTFNTACDAPLPYFHY